MEKNIWEYVEATINLPSIFKIPVERPKKLKRTKQNERTRPNKLRRKKLICIVVGATLTDLGKNWEFMVLNRNFCL
jgi:hypothetical protein